jgi:hypothetical protein
MGARRFSEAGARERSDIRSGHDSLGPYPPPAVAAESAGVKDVHNRLRVAEDGEDQLRKG